MSSYLDDDDIGDDEEEEEIENRRGGQMEEEDDDDFEQRVPHKVAELARASTPASIRGIRACKRCGILKTLDQFLNEGCENCPFLEMGDDPERCNSCTSAFFEGQVAVMDPRESWAAKWLRVDAFLPGVYAISVTGTFDKDMEDDLESRGIRFRCRNTDS